MSSENDPLIAPQNNQSPSTTPPNPENVESNQEQSNECCCSSCCCCPPGLIACLQFVCAPLFRYCFGSILAAWTLACLIWTTIVNINANTANLPISCISCVLCYNQTTNQTSQAVFENVTFGPKVTFGIQIGSCAFALIIGLIDDVRMLLTLRSANKLLEQVQSEKIGKLQRSIDAIGERVRSLARKVDHFRAETCPTANTAEELRSATESMKMRNEEYKQVIKATDIEDYQQFQIKMRQIKDVLDNRAAWPLATLYLCLTIIIGIHILFGISYYFNAPVPPFIKDCNYYLEGGAFALCYLSSIALNFEPQKIIYQLEEKQQRLGSFDGSIAQLRAKQAELSTKMDACDQWCKDRVGWFKLEHASVKSL